MQVEVLSIKARVRLNTEEKERVYTFQPETVDLLKLAAESGYIWDWDDMHNGEVSITIRAPKPEVSKEYSQDSLLELCESKIVDDWDADHKLCNFRKKIEEEERGVFVIETVPYA